MKTTLGRLSRRAGPQEIDEAAAAIAPPRNVLRLVIVSYGKIARPSMRLGVNILNFGPGANPNGLERWARIAEALGYDFAMISDHIAITPDITPQYPAPFYDPFVTLAWLAGLTKRIELGTTVTILPYRHPLQTARMAANIDQLSGGRFIL